MIVFSFPSPFLDTTIISLITIHTSGKQVELPDNLQIMTLRLITNLIALPSPYILSPTRKFTPLPTSSTTNSTPLSSGSYLTLTTSFLINSFLSSSPAVRKIAAGVGVNLGYWWIHQEGWDKEWSQQQQQHGEDERKEFVIEILSAILGNTEFLFQLEMMGQDQMDMILKLCFTLTAFLHYAPLDLLQLVNVLGLKELLDSIEKKIEINTIGLDMEKKENSKREQILTACRELKELIKPGVE